MGLFASQKASTPEEVLAEGIDDLLTRAATANKEAYEGIRSLIHANTAKFTPEQVYAAWSAFTQTGLSAEQLGKAARLMKATLNLFVPGAIVDEVPEAVISFPEAPAIQQAS
jgi:hypothetical protein